jgi:cellulose synthase/poly-beta-1,6-N-acetylglucosamine synthase-like glycosyltransferase
MLRMQDFVTVLGSSVIFVALYFEVFLLISIFESKKVRRDLNLEYYYPPVTILIPCWNEESTIKGTVDSLLALDYPKDKMHIMIVDDGSTDNSRNVLKQYDNHPIVKVVYKENGGKYTALNFGIEHMTTDFVGCLDADSFVDKDALKNIMRRFKDQSVMSVTPAMIIEKPSNILRKMQRAEYSYGNFMRKAYGSIGAIHITPGPFSFFRKEVFDKIGMYKHAHNTEDMEMAMRMQKNRMKIVNAPDAIVYTVGPESIKKLYKQRVRWVSGFLANLIDYRDMILNRKYGDLGILVLPFAIFSICMSFIFIGISLFQILEKILAQISKILVVGFTGYDFKFEWFYLDTSVLNILTVVLFGFIITLIMYGYRSVYGKWKLSLEIFYFLFLYSFIAPFWLIKSIYNNIRGVHAPWR